MGHIVDEAATLDNTKPPHVASIFKLARCRNLSPNQRTEGGKPGEDMFIDNNPLSRVN